MTGDVNDMSTPVTRGELRDELAHFERKFDAKLDDKLEQLERKFDDKLDQLERRVDHKFDLWGGALLARITESENRVIGELARHTQAVFESMTRQISAIDEKYSDLPGRMARLEAEVHALKQR
jgi:predicted nuclease with TOPRIM domain